MNKFEFSGVVSDISYIEGKSGRITKLTVENHDGRWPTPVIVDYFEEMSKDIEVGKEVLIYGTVSGRVYNERVFVGLRASTILVKSDGDAPADDDNLPF